MEILSLGAGMSQVNRVRAWLGKLPSREIEFDHLDQITGSIGELDTAQVRHTLKYLEKVGEIRIRHETTSGGRQFMRGLELVKIASSNEIYDKVAEKVKKNFTPADYTINESKVPHLANYMKQKIAVSKAAELLRNAGMDEQASSLYGSIDGNEFLDEGIYLLQQIEQLTMTLNSTSKQRDDAVIDAQKEQEKAQYWRSKIETLPETQRDKFEAEAPWNSRRV